MTTILLGPQRFTTTLRPALASLGLPDGPIAFINSGWEEREADTEELQGHLDGRGRGLNLYQRSLDVMTKDDVLATGILAFRERVEELRSYYALRIQGAVDTARAVHRRTSVHGLRDAAELASVAALRDVDGWYREQLKELYRDLATRVSPLESPTVGWHKGEIAAQLDGCVALVLPGGRIDVLLQTLRLFDIRIPAGLPVVAWSAGAMALTERVILFHDHARGFTAPELLDHGLRRLPGIAVLPHARTRLALDDPFRMSLLARRFADRRLVLLDSGTMLHFAEAPEPGHDRPRHPSEEAGAEPTQPHAGQADESTEVGGIVDLPVRTRYVLPDGSIGVVA